MGLHSHAWRRNVILQRSFYYQRCQRRSWLVSDVNLLGMSCLKIYLTPSDHRPPHKFSLKSYKNLKKKQIPINKLASFYSLEEKQDSLKPLLHDQIFFVKFHLSKAFWPYKLGGFDKFAFKKPLTHEIWQRKFGRVKGALIACYSYLQLQGDFILHNLFLLRRIMKLIPKEVGVRDSHSPFGYVPALLTAYQKSILIILTSNFKTLARWRGDFADYKNALFPANYCEEINVMTGVVNGEEVNVVKRL